MQVVTNNRCEIIYDIRLCENGAIFYACFVSDNFARRLRLLTDLATKHPDLRDAYLSKSQTAAYKFDIISDEEHMKTQIADIDPVFTDIEAQLAKIKKGTRI